MSTTILTRSKLITRDVNEKLEYKEFGTGIVAIKVSVVVTGIDPFKNDIYAITTQQSFSKAMSKILKSKADFVYSDEIKAIDESWRWNYVTANELKKFSELPSNDMTVNYAYDFVSKRLNGPASKTDRQVHAKKLFNNAIKKDGINMVHFNSYDHSFRDINNKLIPVPLLIDHGFRSSEYKLKPLVDYLRILPNVKMKVNLRDNLIYSEYPEIVHVPYYNADVDGEQEICVWVLPDQKEYESIRGENHDILTPFTAQLHDILDIIDFRI